MALLFRALYGLEKISKKNIGFLRWRKTLTVATTMAAPTAYVITVFVFGLSHWIVDIGEPLGAGRYGEWFLQEPWPLSLEYLLFAASIQLMYGINGLKWFLISCFPRSNWIHCWVRGRATISQLLGELYFIGWILTYLMLIFLLSRRICTKSLRSEPKPKQNGS